MIDCRTSDLWLPLVLVGLRLAGAAVVIGVVPPDLLAAARAGLYGVRKGICRDIGEERLDRAGERGVLRLPLKYDPLFYRFLELPQLLAVVDATVSPTAVLHLQNGFILPPAPANRTPDVFQHRFHMDFPRVLGGAVMSVNLFFALDDFTPTNGATLVVPGTHQKPTPPDLAYMTAAAAAVPVVCPAGSMIAFDSTLWHAAGPNTSAADRLALNHQFTRSYIKPQNDVVRAAGEEAVLAQPPRTQQLLGWYTRVVTSLDEYYRPAEERLYRSGQG